jgi:hypothetical protein
MELSDLFPEEARRATAQIHYDKISGGVRVDSAGCCPVANLLKHQSVWSKLHPYTQEYWKPVMDHASDVVAMLDEAGLGLEPGDRPPEETVDEYATYFDRWWESAYELVNNLCDGWDANKISENDLKKLLGA